MLGSYNAEHFKLVLSFAVLSLIEARLLEGQKKTATHIETYGAKNETFEAMNALGSIIYETVCALYAASLFDGALWDYFRLNIGGACKHAKDIFNQLQDFRCSLYLPKPPNYGGLLFDVTKYEYAHTTFLNIVADELNETRAKQAKALERLKAFDLNQITISQD